MFFTKKPTEKIDYRRPEQPYGHLFELNLSGYQHRIGDLLPLNSLGKALDADNFSEAGPENWRLRRPYPFCDYKDKS